MESSSQASHVFGDLEMESHVSSSKSSSLSYGLSSSSSSLVDPYAAYKTMAADLYKQIGLDIGDIEDVDDHALLAKELNDEFGIDVGTEDLVNTQTHTGRGAPLCSSSYSSISCVLINTPCTGCMEDKNGGRHCCQCYDHQWVYHCDFQSSVSSHSSSDSPSSKSSRSSRSSISSGSSVSSKSSSSFTSSSSMFACDNWSRGDYVRVESRSGAGSSTPFEGWVTDPPFYNGSCEELSVNIFKWNNGNTSFGLSNSCCHHYNITTASPCDCARGNIQAGDRITSWPAHGNFSSGSDPNGIIQDIYVIRTAGADQGKLGVDIHDGSGNFVWAGPCRLL